MTKIKNLAEENQQIKKSISDQDIKRTQKEDALKAEISNKITLKTIQDTYDPIIKSI